MKNSTVEKNQGFSKEELKKMEHFVFQKLEKQSHGRLQEVLNILQVKQLSLEYDMYSKNVKITELLHLNYDFKLFFEEVKYICQLLIEVDDYASMLKEVKEEKSDILAVAKIISEYSYKQNVTITSLGKLKRIDEKSIQRAIDLEAEQVILKEELIKAQKMLKEAREQALINARARLCR